LNAAGRISRRKRAASMLTQRMLLEREGVTMRRGRVDLARHAWDAVASVHGEERRAKRAARAGRLQLRVDDERAWRHLKSSEARQRRGRGEARVPAP
jgi:hypothetical protein